MLSRRRDDRAVLLAIRHTAVVFSPIHFGCIRREIWTSDMMMRADFRATKAGEKRLRHIRATLAVTVREAVIDAPCDVARMERVPMRSLIGIHRATGRERSQPCSLWRVCRT